MSNKIKNLLKGKLTQKILKGSSIIFVMSMLSAFIGYFIRVTMARVLTPAEYGLFFSIFTLIIFLHWIKDFGILQAIGRYIPKFLVENRKDKIKTMVVISLVVQLFLASLLILIFYLLSNYLAVYYFKNENALWILRTMLIYFIIVIFLKTYRSYFQGFQKMHYVGFIEPIKNGTTFIFILLLIFKFGLKGVVVAYIMGPVVVALLLFIPFWRLFPKKEKMTDVIPLSKELILFGLPLVLTAVGGELIAYFDTFALTYFRTLAEVGIYNVVLPTATSVLLIIRSVAITVYPMISEHWAKKEYDIIKKGFRLFYKLTPLLIIPYVLAFFLIKPFMIILFGAKYIAGVNPMRILFVGVFIYFVGMINNNGLAAIGHPKENMKAILVAAILNIILNIILIPHYGMMGAAIATTIAYTWVAVYSTFKVKRLILNVQTT